MTPVQLKKYGNNARVAKAWTKTIERACRLMRQDCRFPETVPAAPSPITTSRTSAPLRKTWELIRPNALYHSRQQSDSTSTDRGATQTPRIRNRPPRPSRRRSATNLVRRTSRTGRAAGKSPEKHRLDPPTFCGSFASLLLSRLHGISASGSFQPRHPAIFESAIKRKAITLPGVGAAADDPRCRMKSPPTGQFCTD
jgi:hypothetical protein